MMSTVETSYSIGLNDTRMVDRPGAKPYLYTL